VRIFAYVGGLAVIAVIAAEVSIMRPAAPAREPTGAAAWVEVSPTFAAFSLPLPELTQDEPRYTIRRNIVGGGRKDILTLGNPNGGGAHLTIELYRTGGELTAFGTPLSEIAARTAKLGPVDSMHPAGSLPSKFGPFALVDFTRRNNGWLQHCLGFVRTFDTPRMQIAGWYCRPGPEIVERRLPACALDRLTLVASGDPRLGELFAKADLRRNFCGQKSPYLTPAVKRPDWMDGNKKPKLRGHLAAG
jgi:hypothetical protein